ncbi:DNA/RNA non-specific endonuclease [Polaromonas sp. CG_9.11]|uniref:DNA/RNA non-specific endonuclease n=1 Tax=Polaromonas sp. CG_9.11 TaxID=2787730 RepID=UPI0018C9067F|nr:DNA/RNA non-specific endonuclease [Polaromonas sp. CG_9.11]MBG6076889.1 endonuclease G [Polaromonas sp. CG_9.11]
MKLPVELLSKAEADYPKTPAQVRSLQSRIVSRSALVLDGLDHLERRRAMIAASARESASLAFERYLGTNDLLPINYLLTGYAQSRAVGRIRYFDKKDRRTAYATGFMVSPELMMTNHHVFPVSDVAEFAALADDAAIEFGYEYDAFGKLGEPVVHALDPEAFLHTSKALDLALVAVRPRDLTGLRQLHDQGYLILNGRLGKAGTGDYATIVQHPDGEEKQIALRNNEIIDNDLPDVLIYKSDTAQGSSGAPVFNNEWQVIALHSSGVAKTDAAGHYLDKHDQVIEVENGRIDESRVVWLSNRGVRVSALMKHLLAPESAVALHPLVQVFSSPAYTDSRPFTTLPRPAILETSGFKGVPVAAQPVSLPPLAASVIEIRVSIGNGQHVVQSTVSETPLQTVALGTLNERKLEDAQDYSTCTGFEEEFMGIRIPMPLPSARLRKQLAFLKDAPGSFTLKYHHFSTILHAVRRVPVVSAINVHGKHRYAALGSSSRKDNWLRDSRVDYDAQLDDRWYAKSGFDKGHLSRREDAEWGTSLALAKAAADLTCSYANAVPQVPAFNRAMMGYHGQWGQLENKLLEAGVKNESSRSARICVFSGPVFLDDDPVYASVQVALGCFKVVVWFNQDGALRTTAFHLSQDTLLEGIAFEALNFDKLFKLQQVPLAWTEQATGLGFAAVLRDADTFSKDSAQADEAALERLVSGGQAHSASTLPEGDRPAQP